MNRNLLRVAVWSAETLLQSIFCSFALLGIRRLLRGATLSDLKTMEIGVLIFMTVSGYVFTTLLCRLVWSSQRLNLYPMVAAALSALHLWFALRTTSFGEKDRFILYLVGAIVVSITTYFGNVVIIAASRRYAPVGAGPHTI